MNRKRIAAFFLAVAFAACWSASPLKYGQPRDADAIARGRELVRGLAACGFCHGETRDPQAVLSGGQVLEDRYGTVIAPNITPHSSGIGQWSTTELVHALRFGVGAGGKKLSKDVHEGYEWMADADLLAIIAYIRTLPPVSTGHERRTLSFVDRNVGGFSQSWREYDNFVPALSPRDRIAYGRYLTDHVAACGSCHNAPDPLFSSGSYLGGGRTVSSQAGQQYAPALVADGIDSAAGWSEDELILFLQTGRTPDGRIVDPDYCPVDFYVRADTSELQAIAQFIHSLQ